MAKIQNFPYLRPRNPRAVAHTPMLILLDPAHGHNTPGKRSPDGTLLEYAYTRDLANQILAALKTKGHNAQLLVPETEDIPLEDRVSRVNAHCRALGKQNVILVSIHVNAAGNDSKWLNAAGWSCYTCKGETQSDKLANCLYDAAITDFPDRRIRKDYSDGDPDWEENFYILLNTLCPAILTENFFMDSRSDRDYLQSRVGKQAVIDTHVEGIIEWLKHNSGHTIIST